jgi:hypothetical protein
MDTYTKVVLTVIAVALSVIAMRDSGIAPAWAQGRAQKVVICDEGGAVCAGIYTGQGGTSGLRIGVVN